MAHLIDFVLNEGLQHITEQIFGYLEPFSLVNCRLVSKSWKTLIDNNKFLTLSQIDQVIMKTKLDKRQEMDFFEDMMKKLNSEDFAIIGKVR